MAFGISRNELNDWKRRISKGEIAFLTHYWLDPRFPGIRTVTKVGCSDYHKLVDWGKTNDLKREWIHNRSEFPHFDLIGERQKQILHKEGLREHINRFNI